jgi:hypothetical protein
MMVANRPRADGLLQGGKIVQTQQLQIAKPDSL